MVKQSDINGVTWDEADIGQRVRLLCQAIPDKKMDQAKIKKLLEIVEPQDQVKLKVLHNAVVDGIKNYQADHAAAKLKDWRSAESALDAFVESLWNKHFVDEQPLNNIQEALVYLKESGWKVTKTSLYRHQKEGKLLPRDNGKYHQRDVDKYARTFLKQQSTGKRLQEKADELQHKKLDIEIKNLEIDNRRKQRADDKEAGLYILRKQMDLEFAVLAGTLDAALRNWVQSGTADWIRMVNGDIKKAVELIMVLNRDLDGHLRDLSRDREYEITIDPEEDETESEPGEEEDL